MGVKGLWRLLLPVGRRISIETLEGKILAIDASVWLVQFLKAMRDAETGSTKPAAHLIGFFRRLAKLRYHGIRPVLVWDGATPEIKKREVQQRRRRREQFASTGQASMQRLAKRLLMEQLKRSKNGKKSLENGNGGGNGAFAPGFQLAEEDAEQQTSPQKPEDDDADDDKKPAAKPDDSHEAIMKEVADLEEQWAVQESLEPENDFDNAVIDHSSQQEQSRDATQSSMYNHTHDVFDVKRISSLPSHERKDAVEEAKRQQRMRSRREFMPVAGQPLEYSQAQLRNFLRSSRLNQEINKMAKTVANNNVDEIGERMASDATRRIVLTRDEDDTNHSSQQSPRKRLQKRASAFRTTKLPPEEEDDDEFEWEDGETIKESTMNGTKDNGASGLADSAAAVGQAIESDEDDSYADGGGGFLVPSKKKPSITTQPAPMIRINSDENDSDGGGGFIAPEKSAKPASAFKTVIDVDDDNDGDGFLPQPANDAKHAQELEDEMLARALQEAESDEPMDSVVEPVARAPSVAEPNGMAKEPELQIDRDAALAARLQEAYDAPEGSSDEDSDTVDWEDGDEDDESDKKIAPVPRQKSPPDPTLPQRQKTVDSDDDGESDDDVMWEDGDEGTDDTLKTSNARELAVKPSAGRLETVRVPRHQHTNGHTNGGKSQSWDDEDDPLKSTGMEGNDFDNVNVVDQNTEALEHAQETASHLTNWAGRAFRRAMAQHAEETGAGSPEKISRDTIGVGAPSSIASDGREEDQNDNLVDRMEDESQPVPPRKPLPVSPTNRESTSEPSRPSPNGKAQQKAVNRNASSSATTSFGGLLQDPSASLDEQMDMFDAETRRRERDMDTITDEMKAEIIQLIELFGIPYVESPAEAEAQCAKLEELGLVDGIVTEDSDVFVFGGNTVYKNIFDDKKYVEAYLASDAKRDLALNRNQFVALAMLLGGDYSEGVKGVGIVNGMEVLQAFDCSNSVREGLSKFRAWLDGFDPEDARKNKSDSDKDLTVEQKFRRKHKTARTQWVAPKNFPAENVMNAYLNPVVDTSNDGFSWGVPDLERLLIFCQRNMGWDPSETRKLLEPVLERLEDTSRQTRLESYFMKYEDDIKFANVKSKRLRAVFEDIQKDQTTEGVTQGRKKQARNKSY